VTKIITLSKIIPTFLILGQYGLLRHIVTDYMTKFCPIMRVFVIESWYSCSVKIPDRLHVRYQFAVEGGY
jgi:hypothetical protein